MFVIQPCKNIWEPNPLTLSGSHGFFEAKMPTVTNELEHGKAGEESWTVDPGATFIHNMCVFTCHGLSSNHRPYAIKIISIISYLWLSEIYHPNQLHYLHFSQPLVYEPAATAPQKKCYSLVFLHQRLLCTARKRDLSVTKLWFFGIGYLGSSEAYYHRKLVGHLLLHG